MSAALVSQTRVLLPPNDPLDPTLLGLPGKCRRIIYDYLFRECWLLVKQEQYAKAPTFKSPHVHISLLYTCKTIYHEARLALFEHLLVCLDTNNTSKNILKTIGSHVLSNIRWFWLVGYRWDWPMMKQMPNLKRLELGGNRNYKRWDLSSNLILHTYDQDGLQGWPTDDLLERYAEEWPKCLVGEGNTYLPRHPLKRAPKDLPYEIDINFRVTVTIKHEEKESDDDDDSDEEEEESNDGYEPEDEVQEGLVRVNWKTWEAYDDFFFIYDESPWNWHD